MLRIKLLRNLLIIALGIALLFPLYEYLSVHPAYNELLTEETENEAVRYASYMVRTLGLENQFLTRESLPEGLSQRLQPASRDKRLIKLRIFSNGGEIIFSTQPDELGTLNKNIYFKEIVAKGRVYSKVVKKDQVTAEGDVAQIDIVETYVPFSAGTAFGGAIEVYYDITRSVGRIKKLSLHSMATTLLMSCAFLLAIFLALQRAHHSLQERDQAEDALRQANEVLEQRVAERTRELSCANVQLTDQIAERTEAQRALSQALEEIKVDREKLDGILSSVPDGVVVTDGAFNVLHMNAAAESIMRTSLERVLGQSIERLSGEVDFLRQVSQYLKGIPGDGTFDFELPGEEDNAMRTYQGRISKFVYELSASPGMILLVRDVTREREVERMKSAFLGMAAHELNTPLTTIIGYTELLTSSETADNFGVEQQKEYLRLIHAKALALGGLIDDLLDVSRVESGRPLTLNYQTFSLNSLVGEVVESYRAAYPQHVISANLPEEPTQVCADLQRLEQVVDHVLNNAVKYSPGGGAIRVSTAWHAQGCEVSIEDDGIGMSEEQLAHIFDRFYRADSSDTAVQGVGLGMSIVRHIVLAHHGDIAVESRLAQGTRVRITLPLLPPGEHPACSGPFTT